IVLVKGRVDRRDETAKLICVDVTVFEGNGGSAPALRVNLAATSLSPDRIGRLQPMPHGEPGESPRFAHIRRGTVPRLPDQHRVDLTSVVGELRVAFGHDAVVL